MDVEHRRMFMISVRAIYHIMYKWVYNNLQSSVALGTFLNFFHISVPISSPQIYIQILRPLILCSKLFYSEKFCINGSYNILYHKSFKFVTKDFTPMCNINSYIESDLSGRLLKISYRWVRYYY